ncbi:MAG: ArnT family glycosyltransferase [Terriglobales bacterium]
MSSATAAPRDTEQCFRLPALSLGVLAGFTAAKLALHLSLSGRYGYFRDELYYLDTARHLAFGYVDMAPLAPLYARLALLLGGSLHVLRAIPAFAGAGVMALTIVLTRLLGGDRFAQALAALCLLVAPGFLIMDSLMTMNAFEPLFWMGAIAVLIRILQTGNSRLWVWFGVLCGLGLENKHSTAFFGFAVVVGLLLTEHRREFLKPWIWIGGAIALLIFLPNLIWQIQHHFPTLQDLENVRREGKNVVLPPGKFIAQQVLTMQPIIFPVWLIGALSLLRRRWSRVLGWAFLAFFVTMMAMHAKDYYLFPIYPLVLAAGAAAIGRWLQARQIAWPKPAILAVIAAVGAVLFPVCLPLLSPPRYLAYLQTIHLKLQKAETHMESVWPQPFADQFGWEDMVREVAAIYNSLPPEQRARTGILAGNYGEAGAIDFFGPKYGLPKAICGHQNHYYWGPPKIDPETVISIQYGPRWMGRHYREVRAAGTHQNPWGMGEENLTFYLGTGPNFKFADIWDDLKHWN